MSATIEYNAPRATNDTVAQIAALEDLERKRAVEDFLYARRGQFERMAASVLRSARVRDTSLTGDVTNILMTQAVAIIEKMATGWRPRNPSITFEVQVRMDSRAQVRSLLDHELPKLSGTVGAQRRYREVQRTIAELTETLERTPTPEEIITATNLRMRATRKDAAREGALVSKADLAAPGGASVSIDAESFHEVAFQVDDGMSALLDLLTSRDLAAEIVRACEAKSDSLGTIAKVWLVTVLDSDTDPGHRSIRAQMAAHAGVKSATVPGLVAEVVATAREVVLARAEE